MNSSARWRLNNPEKARASVRAYQARIRAEKPELARERRNRSRSRNIEAARERERVASAKWRAAHPDEVRAKNVLYRKRHAEKVRRSRLAATVARYGASLADYDRMLSEQNGRCAICQRPPSRHRLEVDHDHATGRIRGLLCKACNTGMGHLGDDVARLEAAITYLRTPR